jgi:hypothetical protein
VEHQKKQYQPISGLRSHMAAHNVKPSQSQCTQHTLTARVATKRNGERDGSYEEETAFSSQRFEK